MALDHLGIIAARLRTNAVRNSQGGLLSEYALKPLDEVSLSASLVIHVNQFVYILQITSTLDANALDVLTNAHQDIFTYLSKRSDEDQAYTVRSHFGNLHRIEAYDALSGCT